MKKQTMAEKIMAEHPDYQALDHCSLETARKRLAEKGLVPCSPFAEGAKDVRGRRQLFAKVRPLTPGDSIEDHRLVRLAERRAEKAAKAEADRARAREEARDSDRAAAMRTQAEAEALKAAGFDRAARRELKRQGIFLVW